MEETVESNAEELRQDQNSTLMRSSLSIGTIVDKTHERFQIIYSLLTGIRTCVLRSQEFPFPTRLSPEHYQETVKLRLVETSHLVERRNNLVDFYIKDYFPQVFRKVRSTFGREVDYLESLTSRYEMNELDSPGKSGSIFYYSHDHRYILKTIPKSEAHFLMAFLLRYVPFVTEEHKETLLIRYVGLYRLEMKNQRKRKYFIVTENIFPPALTLSSIYDIKGSTFGRSAAPKADRGETLKILKDLDLLGDQQRLGLHLIPSEEKKIFLSHLEQDVCFLQRENSMDYSLLLGIAPSDGIPENTSCHLKVSPNGFSLWFGVIDVLTPFGSLKRCESVFRRYIMMQKNISAVDSVTYGFRFLRFIEDLFYPSTDSADSPDSIQV